MRWNTVGLALLAVVGAGLAGAAGFTGWFFQDDHVGPDMPFQPQAWKAVPLYGDDETRLRMARDLRRKRWLEGMTKQEVVALLGPPSEHAYAPAHSLVYWLGPERGFIRIDSAWLELDFQNGRVARAFERTD